MIEFLFAAIIIVAAFGGMAIGVISGRGPLKGGCGRTDGECEVGCAGAGKCDRHQKAEAD